MDKIEEFMRLADEKIGIILAKRLFCVLLPLLEIDKKIIIEKLGGLPADGEKIRRVNRVRKHSGYIFGHSLSPQK